MPSIFKRNYARSKTIPYTANLKRGVRLTAANARRVLTGFPIDKPFTTRAEVNEYLSHDTITCLRCGKEYGSLTNHLWVHEGWNTNTYKEYYGIPKYRGLVGTITHERNKAHSNGVHFQKGNTPPCITGKAPLYRHLELKEAAKNGYNNKWKGYQRIELIKDLITFGCSIKDIAVYLPATEKSIRSVLERQNVKLK